MFYEGYWFNSSLGSAIVYSVISIFTVLGNFLVCVAFGKDPYGQLRRPANYFMVNLAVSDLLMGAFTEPLLASTYWKRKDDIFFAHYVFAVVSGASSLLNLTAMSIIRYYAVKDPFGYQSLITRNRATAAIAAIWLQTAHLAMLPVCGWRTPSYQLYLYGVGFGIPCVFIFLAYFGFYRALRHHTNEITQKSNTQNSKQDVSKNESKTKEICRIKKLIEREKRVTKTIVLILVVFVTCWLPFLVIDIIMVQCFSCRVSTKLHLARDITLTLTYFSSGLNPLLYTWRVRQFRIAVTKLLGMEGIEIVLPCTRANPSSRSGLSNQAPVSPL